MSELCFEIFNHLTLLGWVVPLAFAIKDCVHKVIEKNIPFSFQERDIFFKKLNP